MPQQGKKRREWPFRALSIGNVDRFQSDDVIATTAREANEIIGQAP
jgi:hypothetical protein